MTPAKQDASIAKDLIYANLAENHGQKLEKRNYKKEIKLTRDITWIGTNRSRELCDANTGKLVRGPKDVSRIQQGEQKSK